MCKWVRVCVRCFEKALNRVWHCQRRLLIGSKACAHKCASMHTNRCALERSKELQCSSSPQHCMTTRKQLECTSLPRLLCLNRHSKLTHLWWTRSTIIISPNENGYRPERRHRKQTPPLSAHEHQQRSRPKYKNKGQSALFFLSFSQAHTRVPLITLNQRTLRLPSATYYRAFVQNS